ncbi:MAG TPA: DNA-binding protein WhiA, partial [Syntrophomonadaceae bacterium]|nr:DNA-binding protein WhiA [Syntrophomonadaceae bacterium]
NNKYHPGDKMSFSNEVRNELARIIPNKPCCQRAELAALLSLRGIIIVKDDGSRYLQVESENAASARKVYRLLKDICQLQSSVRIVQRKRFKQTRFYLAESQLNDSDLLRMAEMGFIDSEGNIRQAADWRLLGKSCCKRSYLRGVFMCKGFINRPEGNYHLEIVLNDSRMANDIKKILGLSFILYINSPLCILPHLYA